MPIDFISTLPQNGTYNWLLFWAIFGTIVDYKLIRCLLRRVATVRSKTKGLSLHIK